MFLDSINKINLTFCGMMGSGKSIVGKNLAKKIGFKFIDTDNFIEEKVGKTINDIFTEDGERHFRKLEEKYIIDILKKTKYVISLGGGAIINNNIRKVIDNNSYNIYLKVEINTLMKRLSNSKNRPLIFNKNLSLTLNKLIAQREKFYNKADLIIENEISVGGTINSILKKFKSYD
jgi:shikimate kinase